MCLKMLHHVCLIPFCIIDMNRYESCVFYKELNNLLLSVTSVCPRPGQKKAPHCFFFFLSLSWRFFTFESHILDQDEKPVWS